MEQQPRRPISFKRIARVIMIGCLILLLAAIPFLLWRHPSLSKGLSIWDIADYVVPALGVAVVVLLPSNDVVDLSSRTPGGAPRTHPNISQSTTEADPSSARARAYKYTAPYLNAGTFALLLPPVVIGFIVTIATVRFNPPEPIAILASAAETLVFIASMWLVLLRLPQLRSALDLTPVKLVFSLLVSALFWYGRAQTAQDLASIFHVDPRQLSFALYAGAVLWTLSKLAWILVLAASVIMFPVALVGFYFAPDLKSTYFAWWLIVSVVILISSAGHLLEISSPETRRYVLTQASLKFDFVKNYNCVGADSKDLILFLGDESAKALVVHPLDQSRVPPQVPAVPVIVGVRPCNASDVSISRGMQP
jgi:hypothetical protein